MADLLALKGSEVIAVGLKDAPARVPKEQQPDGRRELPRAAGVIDVAAFLKALNQIGHDGPVRVVPFNQVGNRMPREAACAAASVGLKKALIRPVDTSLTTEGRRFSSGLLRQA